MRNSRKITLAEVRASLNRDLPSSFAVQHFGRPLGDLLTVPAFAFGLSANDVTVLRAGLAALALALIIAPTPMWCVTTAGMLFYICFILDCTDGNLARLQDDASYWGKFIDGLADSVFIQGVGFAVGLRLWILEEQGLALAVGAATTLMTLISQMLRSRLSFMREWMERSSGPITGAEADAAKPARSVQERAAAVYVSGSFVAPLLLVAAVPGDAALGAGSDVLAAFLGALVFVQFLPELVWSVATLAEARIILARHRVSKSAAKVRSAD